MFILRWFVAKRTLPRSGNFDLTTSVLLNFPYLIDIFPGIFRSSYTGWRWRGRVGICYFTSLFQIITEKQKEVDHTVETHQVCKCIRLSQFFIYFHSSCYEGNYMGRILIRFGQWLKRVGSPCNLLNFQVLHNLNWSPLRFSMYRNV